MLFALLEDSEDSNLCYNILSELGFRRSGDYLYAPDCNTCRACIPIRIRAADFRPRRLHKRVLRSNQFLKVREEDARMTPEVLAVYQDYIAARHADSNMNPASGEQFNNFLLSNWSDTRFLEFRLPTNNRLVGVAVTDRTENSLSAVYTFFDPAYSAKNSLGTYAILYQIKLARNEGLDYVYLGYWIRDCNKMSYKSRFRPYQLLLNKRWVEFQ